MCGARDRTKKEKLDYNIKESSNERVHHFVNKIDYWYCCPFYIGLRDSVLVLSTTSAKMKILRHLAVPLE